MTHAKVEIKKLYKIFGSSQEKMLELVQNGLSKERLKSDYDHTLGLEDINLSIEKNETFVIMGLSGSGKSTLIRHINRLIDPSSGEVLIDGENIMDFNESQIQKLRRSKVSMVFQKFGLLPHRNVLENVVFGLKIAGIEKKSRLETAKRWITQVGLDGYETSYPRQLSGGMQQRVGLARALASDPEILLMDEPFSALDPLIRYEMQEVLKKLQLELKKTIIFITHDIDEALELGHKIAILKDGKLIQVGTPQDLKQRPVDNYVAAFMEKAKDK